MQEQLGHYGPIVIDPAGADPVAYDREHVIVLSDWSFLHPHEIITKLKKEGGYFNQQKMTLLGRLSGDPEQRMPAADRAMFAKMRMDPTDILDVTAAAYTYLINGHGPLENWTGLFRPGERVRLRIINAAAMTIFNIRIPGLVMKVVERRRPERTSGRRRGVPDRQCRDLRRDRRAAEDQAYTFVAEAMDRSGMGRATLAPRLGMTAAVPPLRAASGPHHEGHGHGRDGPWLDARNGPWCRCGRRDGRHGSRLGPGSTADRRRDGHERHEHARQVEGAAARQGRRRRRCIAPAPVDRTGDPGLGLEDVGHKVLTYRDLMSLDS